MKQHVRTSVSRTNTCYLLITTLQKDIMNPDLLLVQGIIANYEMILMRASRRTCLSKIGFETYKDRLGAMDLTAFSEVRHVHVR